MKPRNAFLADTPLVTASSPGARLLAAAAGGPSSAHVGERCWLALEFPDLPLSARGLAAPGGAPRAVSVHEGRRQWVLAADGPARVAGVSAGMSVTAAIAVCASLQVHRHDVQAESDRLEGLACWALRYTSQVSVQPPRGLLLEIGASLRLFGGLGPLLQRVREDLQSMGLEVLRGIAPTPTAAWLLARAGVHVPVEMASRLGDAVARVPVTALDLPGRILDDLQAMGLRSLGDCMRLPRDGLGRRFGTDLLALLDRALGRCADPRVYWSPPACFERRTDLAVESVDRSLLSLVLQQQLHELAGFLRARSSGACALELELAHRGVAATRLVLELTSPCHEPEHLLELVSERMEHVPLRHEVVYVGLRVTRMQAFEPEVGDLYGDRAGVHDRQETGRRAQLLVERLGARLGHDAVRVLESVADHRPERSSVETPWQHMAARAGHEAVPASEGSPLWLLPQPQPLQGRDAPVSLDGPLSVEHGPRRIESGWWDGEDVARDYYVACSVRGTRYWIYRECRPPGRWFVHGIFA